MTMKKLSEETEQKIVNPNPTVVTTFLDRHRLAILLKYIYKESQSYSNCHEECPMDAYGWLFILYGRFLCMAI